MDPISDVLASVQIESVCYGRVEAGAPWGLSFAAGPFARFSLLVRGTGLLATDSESDPIALTAGDFILFAPGQQYTLRDGVDSSTISFDEAHRSREQDTIRIGGDGASATLINGKFHFDPANEKPLRSLLPPWIHIRAGKSRTVALEKTLELLTLESAEMNPGYEVIRNQAATLLFTQALREYMMSAQDTSWLRALADPQIGTSLRSMHQAVQYPWTVARLASTSGMSRSAYAERFRELMGETPLGYLTRWRIHRASQILRRGDQKIGAVAQSVGYRSDEAFHKAFKRVLGQAPGEYRRSVVR